MAAAATAAPRRPREQRDFLDAIKVQPQHVAIKHERRIHIGYGNGNVIESDGLVIHVLIYSPMS